MMTINENTIGTWYVQVKPTTDFCGTLSRDPTDNSYVFIWRFRYYKDDKTFDSADEKHWYKIRFDDNHQDMLKMIQERIQAMANRCGGEMFEILMKDKNISQFIEELTNSPFAHHKSEWRN